MLPILFTEISQFAVKNNIEIAGPPIYVTHETSKEDIMRANSEGNADLEAVIPVSEKIEGVGDVKCYELPGGNMVKVVHNGPYEDTGPTYQELFAWIDVNGLKITGLKREAYLNDPHDVPPEDILTEIYVPIK
ncbi:GyrI-like domain-containing protein [Methanococcoides burtonii]|uniref:AraC_E_bind-containing bacterial regulation effector protein n=1 Tax=Methanococcoides burtonii (strain DSM 6242 / NBRC 107633 / OCM 468 / ACE-M) TaxID=259564 RepID=Q12WP7_METBU|nr:GyrI-like domain-containing protein [Methanococcoides burtonii]ABE52129.1 AraC_E_bind-containing bacterial regulation effector protein [Methanococcoides burtonii DSM 6242]